MGWTDRKILYVMTASTARTLSEKTSGADRDRTDDLRLAKPALSQLSYSPEELAAARSGHILAPLALLAFEPSS
jgi:hypothetical protein